MVASEKCCKWFFYSKLRTAQCKGHPTMSGGESGSPVAICDAVVCWFYGGSLDKRRRICPTNWKAKGVTDSR